MTIPASPTLQLGLNLPYVDGSMDGRTPRWADIVAMAQAAERIGFDAVWISDHVGFGDPDGDWSGAWESWTLLSALASATVRVQLGTYVLAMPFRNPALLAKQAETLDEVSDGRVSWASAPPGMTSSSRPTGCRSIGGSIDSRTGCGSSPRCSGAGARRTTAWCSLRAPPCWRRAGRDRTACR